VIERVIENWLTNANEVGFTLPFCEVLVSEGYSVIRVARGGPGEHGKDVIARDSAGRLHTFQLKGGDINLKKWGDIRSQVEDLVRLPAFAPSVSKDEPHEPHLVTNGEISADAATNIEEYSAVWVKGGAPALDVITGGRLLRRFLDAHGKFMPTDRLDFRHFVELYVADHRGLLPRKALATFLEGVVASVGTKATMRKRAVESMVLLGSYLVEGYQAAKNHVAAAMGWTIVAMVVMHVAEREQLPQAAYQESLDLAWMGLDAALHSLEEEVLARSDFVEPTLPIVEPAVHGVRVLIVLGWLATGQLLHSYRLAADAGRVARVFRREIGHQRFAGEADWPNVMATALFIARQDGQASGEALLQRWLDVVLSECAKPDGSGIPSPYWLPESVLALRGGFVAPHDQEQFGNRSYTAGSAADMLVRRLCRQAIATRWPSMSNLALCDFAPSNSAEWFVWSAKTGDTVFEHPEQTRSWAGWRSKTASWDPAALPDMLQRNSQWLLPMMLTYPHRANRLACAAVDGLIGDMVVAG
jgi:hypothetical protein